MILLFKLPVIGFCDHPARHILYVTPGIAVSLHVFQSGIASLALNLKRPVKLGFCVEVAVLECGECFSVEVLGICLLLLILGESISPSLKLSCAHQSMLGSLVAYEA